MITKFSAVDKVPRILSLPGGSPECHNSSIFMVTALYYDINTFWKVFIPLVTDSPQHEIHIYYKRYKPWKLLLLISWATPMCTLLFLFVEYYNKSLFFTLNDPNRRPLPLSAHPLPALILPPCWRWLKSQNIVNIHLL